MQPENPVKDWARAVKSIVEFLSSFSHAPAMLIWYGRSSYIANSLLVERDPETPKNGAVRMLCL